MVKIYVILLILFIPSCDVFEPQPVDTPDELLSAPEKIIIDGREFIPRKSVVPDDYPPHRDFKYSRKSRYRFSPGQ